MLIRAVAAAVVAAVTAALEVTGGEDHGAVFELVVFALDEDASE